MNMTNNISYSLEIIDYDLRIVLSFLFCFTFWGVCVCVWCVFSYKNNQAI